MDLDATAASIADAVRQHPPTCGTSRVIAIDGPSGAGKTDLAERIASTTGATVLHLDDLHPGWHGLEAAPPMAAEMLASMADGKSGHGVRWDWENDRPGQPLVVAPAPLLIVEGVGAGAGILRPFLSMLVWVEAPTAVRRDRALARDGQTYAPFWDVWAEQEREHHTREMTRTRADLVVHT